MSCRCGHLHELMPCIKSEAQWPCQAKIDRVQIIHNHSQPGLPRVYRFCIISLCEGSECRPEELENDLDWSGISTTKMVKERQALSTDSIWQEWLIRMRPNHVNRDKNRFKLMAENTRQASAFCVKALAGIEQANNFVVKATSLIYDDDYLTIICCCWW